MNRSTLAPGLALALAIFAVSWGSIFVRFCTAPPLVIGFYRLGFASLLLLPLLAVHRGRGRFVPSAGVGLLALTSGLLLALHFATWISSLALTTVGSSVVLVSTQPAFSALLSGLFLGEKPPRRLYLGVTIGLIGTLLIAGGDVSFSTERLKGDLLALAGAVTSAGYFIIGRHLRVRIPLLHYLFLVYGSASLFLGVIAAASGTPLRDHPAPDYFWFLMMALVSSLVGHGCFNWAVRHLRVYLVNLAAFGEPVLATIYAYLLFGEPILATLWIGALLVFAGILLALPGREDPVPVN